MKPIYNVNTKQLATMPCSIWGNRSLGEDLDAQAIADGWRYVVPAPHGERYMRSDWADTGTEYRETAVDFDAAQWAAIVAAREAKVAADAAAPADIQLGKATLRTHADGSVEILSGTLILPGTSNGAYEIFVDSETGLVLTTLDHAGPRKSREEKDAAKAERKAKIALVKAAKNDSKKLDALLDLLGLK